MTAPGGRWTLLAWALLAGSPGVVVSIALLWTAGYETATRWAAVAGIAGAWVALSWLASARMHRPLRAVANVLTALRQGDYSVRARGADARSPLSPTLREANALEELIRSQRLDAAEASSLLQRVLAAIEVAVFAFDDEGRLCLVNKAGEYLTGVAEAGAIGESAASLGLDDVLAGEAPRTVERDDPTGPRRWQLRRSAIRMAGRRLTLVVLTDLSSALREEERQTWRRLVRVLGHEINNSLSPIKSIAGSIRGILLQRPRPENWVDDVTRGLDIVSTRAEALERFMAAYARLARLPPPALAELDVAACVRQAAGLETRVAVTVHAGPEVSILADHDQIEQALINLLRNAADAALQTGGGVEAAWRAHADHVEVTVEDEGPGLASTDNLFVPFYSTKAEGSGIGLVLSRHIAENHGGSLALENRTDRTGARARLVLPTRRHE